MSLDKVLNDVSICDIVFVKFSSGEEEQNEVLYDIENKLWYLLW